MRSIEDLFAALNRSDFRKNFSLDKNDRAYLQEKGLDVITTHARDFISKRLAPAHPNKDAKQTPWRGHPVFVAQHATASCCRGCLAKWHYIKKGVELTTEEQDYLVTVITTWLKAFL